MAPGPWEETLFDGIHRNSLSVLAKRFVRDRAVDHGKQGVVAAATDVDAGVDDRAQLADQNIAGPDDLAAEPFDATPLSGAVAAVA